MTRECVLLNNGPNVYRLSLHTPHTKSSSLETVKTSAMSNFDISFVYERKYVGVFFVNSNYRVSAEKKSALLFQKLFLLFVTFRVPKFLDSHTCRPCDFLNATILKMRDCSHGPMHYLQGTNSESNWFGLELMQATVKSTNFPRSPS
jgi:hypothetical protein